MLSKNETPDRKKIRKGEITPEQLEELRKGVKRVELLADILDKKMLDPILGTFVGAGDSVSALISLYIINEAKKAGVSRFKLAKMMGRNILDWAGGSIPIAGDLFDVVYKDNKKNAEVLRKHFDEIEKKVTQKQIKKLKEQVEENKKAA